MHEPKKQRTYRMSAAALMHIEEVADNYGITSTAALEKIIKDHRDTDEDRIATIADTVSDTLLKRWNEEHNYALEKAAQAAAEAEFNSLVALEVLNTLAVSGDVKEVCTSRIGRGKVWLVCEEEVRRRLADKKMRKDHLQRPQ